MKKNIRILGNNIKKTYIHPIFLLHVQSNTSKKLYPTEPYYNKKDNRYEFNYATDISYDKISDQMLNSFMEKPYIPFTDEMILHSFKILNKIISLEKYYDYNKNNKLFIFLFKIWMRTNITELEDKIQLQLISKFCKKLLKDKFNKNLDEKKIEIKLLKWKSENNEENFEYNILDYLLK